jgi:spore coat polysaccharide biosynthesis predicted glycosyltransferase SpsG
LFTGNTIFISALDWGLGHATRCVPLIRQLQKDNKIILGTTTLTSVIFDEEFPELEKVEVPSYNIHYSKMFSVGLKLFFDSPRILGVIKSEKKCLDKIIKEKNIDVVISDNRFGLYSENTKNIIISHQIFLKSPFANFIAQKINKSCLLNFDELWIPDHEDPANSLSGELSHGKHFHPNVKYIGPLSRLEKTPIEKKYDYLLLLSGPEPQQSILRDALIQIASKATDKKFALVTNSIINTQKNIGIFCLPGKSLLEELICSSDNIICRSGYSTLMDLFMLEIKSLTLIPTPGQTEQEYLAEYWKKNKGAEVVREQDLQELLTLL